MVYTVGDKINEDWSKLLSLTTPEIHLFCLQTGLNWGSLLSSRPVLRIRDVYPGSLIFTHPGSRIPDYPGSLIFTHPGSRIPDPKTAPKGGGKKICCHNFLCSYNFHKIENYFSFRVLKKKIWANFQRIIELFTQ
jgi:hypothetical protein